MKKFKLLLTLGVSILAFSCSKDYSCKCDVKHEQTGPVFTETREWDQSFTFSGKEDDVRSEYSSLSFSESYKDGAEYDHKIEQDCPFQ
ncbi:MAG: hypothetical protein MK078_00760 [Crocinitomicaceae bacterium]|nr:hypothetical protein [Crocinitomicaceae bacterium]